MSGAEIGVHMGLTSIDSCPVCGDSGRVGASDGIASKRWDSGRYYLKHAAQRLDMTLEKLLETVKVYQCTTCQSYYCDPWLKAETATYIFTEGAPDHIAGWANFEHWLSSAHPIALETNNLKLYHLLCTKIGPLSAYAEYGCPFQGFLLLFKGLESSPKQRVLGFSTAIHRQADMRWTTGPKLHHAAQGWAHRVVAGYHRLRAYKHGEHAATAEEKKVCLPSERYLLTQANTNAWGNNCVRYGGSCNYYASKTLGADVLPFENQVRSVERDRATTVDLLGIFNILDHTDAPFTVIRDGLKVARHIIVVTHHASLAGKQHLFAFHDSFPAWLATSLPQASVEDLTPAMIETGKQDYNYILISNKDDQTAKTAIEQ